MAAVTIFTNYSAKLHNKEVDWNSDTIKGMITTNTYVPDQNAHAYKSDVTNEITGTGYSAGGATLTTCTITVTGGGSHVVKLDADDLTWAATINLTGAKWLVLYDNTPASDATRPLIGYLDLGNINVSGGPLTIVWDSAGVFQTTTA